MRTLGQGVSMAVHNSEHLTNFISNLREVYRLADIHTGVAKAGPGRKHNVEILHKSTGVLLVRWCVPKLPSNDFLEEFNEFVI
jgi:hypothetical protein